MTNLATEAQREVEMGVQVLRARTGRRESVVPEALLERHGFGLGVSEAVERYRAEQERLRAPDEWPWTDTDIRVVTDEEAGYPSRTFRFVADLTITTTRESKALRELAQYLLDVANGLNPEPPAGFEGQGFALTKEE